MITKCLGFRKLMKENYIKKKTIDGIKYYVIMTRKKGPSGTYIDLILHNCPICGREIYPKKTGKATPFRREVK